MDAPVAAAWVGIVVTLGIAIVGWSRANRADQRAARAIDLAEAAEARAQRLENAQFERSDVRWDLDWRQETATLTVRNVGLDAAHEAELIADPLRNMPGQRKTVPPATVGPTEAIELDLRRPIAAATGPAARARARQAAAEINLAVRVQVTWRSGSGVAGVERWDEVELLNLWQG